MHEAAMANGPITQWLAIIGAVSLIYWIWRIGAALMNRGGDKGGAQSGATAPPPVAVPGAPAPGPTVNHDIAVIAAAVYATLGAHRIVHLEAAHPEQNWAFEGRMMQQTSHRPHA